MAYTPPDSIFDLAPRELKQAVAEMGQPAYRAQQLSEWLYDKRSRSFEEMSNLPRGMRDKLATRFTFDPLRLEKKRVSKDGTVKFLFRLGDDRDIETVLIPSETLNAEGESKRLTLCVSTQVGCPLDCKFCATATLKLKRNLSAGEIVGQFMLAQRETGRRITNMVFMGMGEPMLNYDNVMRAVETLINPDNQVIGPKRITLSTSGIVKNIVRMADEQRPIKLAISLHALRDKLRTELMPINKRWNLRDLGRAIEYYYNKTNIPVTYEYILFDGLNDSMDDVKRLAKLARRVPSKVNVIPFHPIDFTNPTGFAAELKATTPEKFNAFIAQLRALDVTVMIRSSSGKDIEAACGQLALSNTPEIVV